MGNCGSCKDCSCDAPKQDKCGSGSCGSSYPTRQEIDIHHALHAKKPKQRSDPTSLNARCTCRDGMNVPRYMCLHCIRSWVESQEEDAVREQIEIYTEAGKVIAVERLEAALKEKLSRG